MSDIAEIQIIVDEEANGEQILEDVFQSEEDRQAWITWITGEIELAYTERKEREAMWARWRRQRLARPAQEVASYPWKGASNIVPTEAMSLTNTAFAQLKGKYMEREPLWSVKATREADKDYAKAIEDLINYCGNAQDQMNLRKHNNTIFYDALSLGTQFGKILWDIDQIKYRRNGEEIIVVTHDGPNFRPIRLEDFLCRAYGTELDNLPWYSVITEYYEHELRAEAQQGQFKNVESVLENPMTELDDNKKEEKARLGDSPDLSTSQIYKIHEISCFWDVDKDGVMEDIRVWFDADNGIILREEFNELGFRDVQRFPFMTVPYELYGLGIGWMADQMQEELTTCHNMAINSAHLNSNQVLVGRKGTDLDDQEIRPAAFLEADDPANDVKVLTFPDVTSSMNIQEAKAKQYLMSATGINYAMGGLPDQTMKSRFSPTGYQQQASTGATILEIMSKNFDEAYGELGKKVFYLLLAHTDQTVEKIFPKFDKDTQERLTEVFTRSEQDIREAFSFSVKVTPMDETEDAKQQRILMLTQMYVAFIQQIVGLIATLNQTQDQQVKEVVTRGIIGYTNLTKETIEYMSTLKAQDMVPYVDDLEFMISMMDMQRDAQLSQAKEQIRGMDGSSSGAMAEGSDMGINEGMGAMAQGSQRDQSSSNTNSPVGSGAGSTGEITVYG